jgi:hypothetical protein
MKSPRFFCVFKRLSWSQNNILGAFNSPLKLIWSDSRNNIGGIGTLIDGFYWSSTVNGTEAWFLYIGVGINEAYMSSGFRAGAMSVRCIKD